MKGLTRAVVSGLRFKCLARVAAVVLAGGAAMPDRANAAELASDLPASLYKDPEADPVNPAIGKGIQFRSHDASVNGQLYVPAGKGPHPTVLLLHGLPGNEQNLDLAQTMRRQGWTVITFHYRGSWGSGGKFSLKNGIDDAAAVLALLQDATIAQKWSVDSSRIVLVGHSYGGYIAAHLAKQAQPLLGVGLIAPWDISFDARAWAQLSRRERQTVGLAAFDDIGGRLFGASPQSLFDEVMHGGRQYDLTKLAPLLTDRKVLVVTATRDDDDDKALGLLAALNQDPVHGLTALRIDSDHGFNDRRIALQAAVIRWLASLDGASPRTTYPGQ